MRQKGSFLIAITMLLLSGCNASSSISTFSDSSNLSSSSTLSSSIADPTDSYEISSSCISNAVFAGSSFTLQTSDDNVNYVILDSKGIIAYTACHLSAGYGTKLKCYISSFYSSVIKSSFSAGKINIPEGFTGYDVTNSGYFKFMNEVSNKGISLEDAENSDSDAVKKWNSSSNSYLNDSICIKLSGDDPMETRNTVPFRFSSIYDTFDSTGEATYLTEVPHDDSYSVECGEASEIILKNIQGEVLKQNDYGKYDLKKGDQIYATIKGPAYGTFTFKVTLTNHLVELPYEVSENPDLSSYDTSAKEEDPLTPCDLEVTKRDDGKGLYVNCNNPEALYDEALNTVLTGQDVSDKDVFFTYEHNNKSDKTYYYGYRVTNTGETDIFVTVKNLGNQIKGDGCWLGEDEWIQFYNLPFKANTSGKTKSQMDNFNAYVGFSGNYKPEQRQPITYRIPAGKYIYVIGGTTQDAYKNINVFNSADEEVNSNVTGCSNGAVLFSVSGGKAFGQFMAYTDRNAATINASKYVTEHAQYGYSKYIKVGEEDKKVGMQYAGYDNCHGVVDTNLTWEFNDDTKAGGLPVAYENPYYAKSTTGDPYTKTNTVTKTFKKSTSWVTHINPASTSSAVGTDMTKYITTDHDTGEDIIIEPESYDGLGQLANIGNWMVDYIDTLTLINSGDTPRTVNYTMKHNGVILAFIRDENGFVDYEAYNPTYQINLAASNYGAEFVDNFDFSITVPAHSVKRFSVNYNLCANSSGHITHNVKLK